MAGCAKALGTAQLPAMGAEDGEDHTEPARDLLMLPRSGDVVRLATAASVQFVVPRLFRVIRCHDWRTYEGWVWLDGYELNAAGDAVERRSVFVQISGLQAVTKAPDPRTRNQAREAPRPRPGTPPRRVAPRQPADR